MGPVAWRSIDCRWQHARGGDGNQGVMVSRGGKSHRHPCPARRFQKARPRLNILGLDLPHFARNRYTIKVKSFSLSPSYVACIPVNQMDFGPSLS